MHEHEYFLLPHKIHINCHITIMAILEELLPQPPDHIILLLLRITGIIIIRAQTMLS
jgi:hypothetical protein